MKELSEILGALRRGAGEGTSLVSVVAVEGSTYRRPGARMLVTPAGRIGSISGGCLEDEVCRKAWWLAEKGPAVVTYDTGLDEEPGEGGSYALGCRGRVTVLIERLDATRAPYLQFIEDCQAAGRDCVVATVIGVEGSVPACVGDRPMLGAAGDFRSGPSSEVLAELPGDVRAVLDAPQSRQVTYELSSGRVHVLIELVPPPVELVGVGAGHDAEPLVAMAKELGWRVSLVARKLTQGVRTRFNRVDHALQISDSAMEEITQRGLSTRAAAIIMSHDYASDLAALSQVVESEIPYIGVLGPRHRTDTLVSDLAAHGGDFSTDTMARIHAPIGLDIGAESPEQVALAVTAEVQAFYAKRSGGPLRDRSGPIHDAVPAPVKANSITIEGSCGLDSGS